MIVALTSAAGQCLCGLASVIWCVMTSAPSRQQRVHVVVGCAFWDVLDGIVDGDNREAATPREVLSNLGEGRKGFARAVNNSQKKNPSLCLREQKKRNGLVRNAYPAAMTINLLRVCGTP